MGSRTLFSLKVIRCPACHARLPVQGGETVVKCEYCDARVQLSGASPPKPKRPAPVFEPAPPIEQPTTHVATPHYSGFAWIMLLVPFLSTAGVVVSLLMSTGVAVPWDDLLGHLQTRPEPEVVERAEEGGADRSDQGELMTLPPDEETLDEVVEDDEPGRVGRLFAQLSERAEEADPKDQPRPTRTRSSPKQPEGPVLSVAEAKKQLEPDILKCLKAAKVHRVTARMGNKTVGGVAILGSASVAKPRVDGKVVKLATTALGRCMNEAGKTVRTSAFGGNYIIVDVRNPDVRDPLGDLPEQPPREALVAAVTALDDQVKTCAKTHGQQGRRTGIRLRIDGPSGKLLSANASHTSKAFSRCVETLYRGIGFPKTQRPEVEYHHNLTL